MGIISEEIGINGEEIAITSEEIGINSELMSITSEEISKNGEILRRIKKPSKIARHRV